MKINVLNSAFVALLVFLSVACNTTNEAPPAVVIDKEQIKQEIQAKENEFAALYNSKEMKNIGYYAEDAISYSQNKAPLVGREAIVAYYKENMDTSLNKISFTTNEVFVSNDGMQVVEIGYYKLVNESDSVVNTGHYMSLFEKRDGKYVSVRDMSTSDLPLN